MLNLESLSITSVFSSITNFFKSQENQTKWRSIANTSEGSFLIRLLSNVFSAISYRIVAQSRENFLSTAALPSSNIGISVNLGYSAFRGSNLKRKVKLTSNGDYTFPRLSIIGNYDDEHDIIVLGQYNSEGKLEERDVVLEEGETTEIGVVVGKIKEETVIAGTSAIKVFSLFTTGISEDYTLYLDSQEVPTTKVIKDMVNDKYLVRTNPYSSVDIAYLNTYENFKYKYGTDSELTIRYVELSNMSVVPFTIDMFSNYGTLEDYTTTSTYIPFETVEEMKVNAPLHHELQNLIRSKADYANRLSEVIPSVFEASFEAITPTYTLISYLKNDLTLLTESEKNEFNKVLVQENFFGTPLPDITPPRRAVAQLQINLALKNKYQNISDIKADINNLLANYYDTTLGLSFSTYTLERQLENLSYVKYARVSYQLNDRIANNNYQLGYMLYNNDTDTYYEVAQILGSSGSTEPSWNVPLSNVKPIDTGLETTDGSLYWRTYKNLPNIPTDKISKWQKNFPYGIGDYVRSDSHPNYMFKCVDLIKSTGSNEPVLTNLSTGDFIVDGGIVWVVKTYSSEAPVWSSYSRIRLGESRNTATSNSVFTLECISYTGTVGTTPELSFEKSEYEVIGYTNSEFKVSGDKTFYFKPGDIIRAASTTGLDEFNVANVAYSNSTNVTTIVVQQSIDTTLQYTALYTEERGTKDGQVLWKMVEDITSVQYDWNMYMTFEYNLDII